MDVLRPDGLVDTVVAELVVNESHVDEIHETDSDIEATAVNDALSRQTDVLLLHGKDKRGPFSVRILHIIVRIQRTDKRGILLDVKGDIVLKINGTRNVVPFVQHDTTAST